MLELVVRVTFRVAFAVGNPITREQAAEAQRYPFAVLQNVTP
jgi:hypothetical protein